MAKLRVIFSLLSPRQSILRTLQIRESEGKLVSRLFIFEFFQGAAIAIFFTAAISIFIEHLPATELPKVFLLSAALLWISGFVYSKLEHKLLTRNLIALVLLFNGVSIILFRVFIPWQDQKWFLYLFLASFNILYLLNNLEFWGLVAQLFDVRQSKRLFSIVSAGDVPAKMVGYLMALALSSLIGIENLLWIAAGCVMIAAILFIPLSRTEDMKNLAPSKHHHYATQSLQNIQTSIRANKLIRNAAFVSFFAFSFYILVNFVLYGYIKTRFHTDKSLAIFFSVFFAVSRCVTLVLKLALTNRLVNKIGLRKSLLIAPSLLLLLSAVACAMQSSNVAFYLYGVMAITVDILRSAIQSPVLLATLQPLPTSQRLRGHTIIKGLMDPFAYFASGLFLIILLSSPIEINFTILSFVLLGLAIFWILSCLSVDKNYIQMLTAAIRRRVLDGRDMDITDNESLQFLLSKMDSKNEKEVLSILQLVSSQPVDHEAFYLKALQHDSVNVKKLALQLILDQQYHSLLPDLKKIMQQQPGSPDLHHFVRTVGMLDKTEDVSAFLQHSDKNVVNAAALALLSHPDEAKKVIGETHLLKLFDSGDIQEQLQALQIVRESKAGQFSQQVYALLQQEHEEVRYNALQTAGILGDENLTDHLLSDFLTSKKDYPVLNALRLSGDAAVSRIKLLLQKSDACNQNKRRKLFVLLGKIESSDAIAVLEESIQRFPQDAGLLLSILFRLKYRCTGDRSAYENLLRQTLSTAAGNVSKLHFLENHADQYPLIIRAIRLELFALRDQCICLFSFLYDFEKIHKANSGFDLNTKESLANSFELVERTVPREFAALFTTIFEYSDLPNKHKRLEKIHDPGAASLQNIVRNILTEEPDQFNEWTKACVLYSLSNENGLIDGALLEDFTLSENVIIKELAETITRNRRVSYTG